MWVLLENLARPTNLLNLNDFVNWRSLNYIGITVHWNRFNALSDIADFTKFRAKFTKYFSRTR